MTLPTAWHARCDLNPHCCRSAYCGRPEQVGFVTRLSDMLTDLGNNNHLFYGLHPTERTGITINYANQVELIKAASN